MIKLRSKTRKALFRTGRLGPPTNLRAGGAHRDKRKPARGEARRRAIAESLSL